MAMAYVVAATLSVVLGRTGLLCHAGMILDVTRWLPEHPGGSTIIPAQALNIECSRFFEVGHESAEMQVKVPL
jgi:cytochrome b involved in lipid metabolism